MDTDLESFLNSLGEAERAGGRILHELTDQAQSLELREMLKKVGHDEGYFAGELAAHVRGAAVRAVGLVPAPNQLLEVRFALHADVFVDRHLDSRP